MPPSDFGAFASVFDKGELRVPGHLPLLGLVSLDEANIVADRIQGALRSPQHAEMIERMLRQPNWRPHLVAALAMLLDVTGSVDPGVLWEPVRKGSWVTPQLMVAAHLLDPGFADRALEVLAGGCQIEPHEGMGPVERHSATGPAGTTGRAAKLLATLLEIGGWVPAIAQDIARLAAKPEFVVLAQQDRDNSAKIAIAWRARVLELLSIRGRVL